MRLFVCASVALSASVCSAQTMIGPLPYLSAADSPFDTSHPTYVLETFEDDLFNIPGVTSNLTSASVIGPGGLTDSVDADDGVINGNGTQGHSFFNGAGGTGVTFIFDAILLGGLPTHAGVVWTDGAGTTMFEAFGPGDMLLGTIGPVSIADGSFTGQTAEDHFFGVINAGGVTKITISNTSGGIEVDHFQFSFAPQCPMTPDLNGDGNVNAADLAILLGSWGNCPREGCCAADLDDSGLVDAADLAIELGAWTG